MSAAEVQLIKACMAKIMVGTEKPNRQHGLDFYKYFFSTHPELRVYFKGAETFTAEDVQKSERFDKLGQAIVLALHLLANTYDNIEVYKGYVRYLMDRHAYLKIDPALWKAFFPIWIGFLESKMPVDDASKKAWTHFGEAFNAECQRYLKSCGLPSA